nr:hypothetical protein [Tanacetum cinerariifolium]
TTLEVGAGPKGIGGGEDCLGGEGIGSSEGCGATTGDGGGSPRLSICANKGISGPW